MSSCFIIIASLHSFFHLHEVVQGFGLIPAQALRLHGLTFVTSFFLHAGIIHLIGNMHFLLVFGDDVESFLGRIRYIALITIAAFVGDLIHIASDPNFTIPCVGASGGIAGVITFYAFSFPQTKIGFLWRYFFYFLGSACQPGSFSSSGSFSKSSAPMSKRPESARFHHLRSWAAPRSVWRPGS